MQTLKYALRQTQTERKMAWKQGHIQKHVQTHIPSYKQAIIYNNIHTYILG